jgi:hypothetical protein
MVGAMPGVLTATIGIAVLVAMIPVRMVPVVPMVGHHAVFSEVHDYGCVWSRHVVAGVGFWF